MYAYNPKTGQTVEITEYGFTMLEPKGWVRTTAPATLTIEAPAQQLHPPVDMKAEMEKRKREIAAQKAGNVTEIALPIKELIPDDDLQAEQPQAAEQEQHTEQALPEVNAPVKEEDSLTLNKRITNGLKKRLDDLDESKTKKAAGKKGSRKK